MASGGISITIIANHEPNLSNSAKNPQSADGDSPSNPIYGSDLGRTWVGQFDKTGSRYKIDIADRVAQTCAQEEEEDVRY